MYLSLPLLISLFLYGGLGPLKVAYNNYYSPFTPAQAEVAAILWALNLAIFENWYSIMVEGDAKICFEPLSKEEEPTDWPMSSIIRSAFDLSLSFFLVVSFARLGDL